MIPRDAQRYCCEDLSLIENYELAKNDPEPNKWCIHHRDECRNTPSGLISHRSVQDLIDNDRYFNCPAKELIFLTQSDHWKLHHEMGTFSWDEDFSSKVSRATKAAMKNIPREKFAYWKDKKQTKEQKAKKLKLIKERKDAYWEYKANGGTLKYNEFQHEFFNKKTRKNV